MKNRFYLLSTFFILITFLSSANSFDKMRIAVMEFKAVNVPRTTATVVSDIIRTEMINIGKYVIIERDQVNLILKETGFQQSGCTNESCAVKIGKLLSARKLLVGTISKLGKKYVINGRLVDVERGISEFGENVIADSEDELANAVKLFTSNLSSRIKGFEPAVSFAKSQPDENEIIIQGDPNIIFQHRLDGSILDSETGLIWQLKPSSKKMTWGEAISHINKLNRKESKNWRMPSKKELAKLLIGGNKRSCDVLNKNGFENIMCENYWTNSTDSSDARRVWCIDIGTDFIDTFSKESENYIWAVRELK